MKRTIIQVSEEQLEYMLDNLPAPSENDSSEVRVLRDKLREALNECRVESGKSVQDYN